MVEAVCPEKWLASANETAGFFIDIPFTALASEWQEVKLMAERHLAVCANRFYVADGHLGVAVFEGVRRRRGILLVACHFGKKCGGTVLL
jgi:hypothetical protein